MERERIKGLDVRSPGGTHEKSETTTPRITRLLWTTGIWAGRDLDAHYEPAHPLERMIACVLPAGIMVFSCEPQS